MDKGEVPATVGSDAGVRIPVVVSVSYARASREAFRRGKERWAEHAKLPDFIHITPTARLARVYRREEPGYPAMVWEAFMERLSRRALIGKALVPDEARLGIIERSVGGDRELHVFLSPEGVLFPGTVTRLDAAIQEIKANGLSPPECRRRLENAGGTASVIVDRLRALVHLFDRYNRELDDRGFMDRVDREIILAKAIDAGEDLLKWIRLVILDGFLEPTPVQRMLIKAISRKATIWAALPAGGERTPQGVLPARAIEFLGSIGKVELEEIPADERAREIDSSWFPASSKWGSPRSPGAGGIFKIRAQDREAEVEAMAERINAIAGPAGKGFDYSRIGVAFKDAGRYAPLVREIFDRYGIPHAVTLGFPLSTSTVGALVLALLRAVEDGYHADDILRIARTPLVRFYDGDGRPLDPDDVSRLVVRGRIHGGLTQWRGRLGWLEEHPIAAMVEGAGESQAPEQGDEDGRRKESLLKTIRATGGFLTALSSLDGERSVEEHVSRLRELLVTLNIIRRAAVLGLDYLEPYDFEREARALESLQEALDELVFNGKLAGGSPVPLRAFRILLERVLGSRRYEPREALAMAVQVMGIRETRGMTFDTLFIGGLVEGVFPGKENVSPVLPPAGRTILGLEETDPLNMDALMFHSLLAGSGGNLFLSAPAMDADGNPLVPSLFLEEAERTGLVAKAPALDGGARPARQTQLGIGAALSVGGGEAVKIALGGLLSAPQSAVPPWGRGLVRGALVMAEREGRAAPGRFSGILDAPDLKGLLGRKYSPGRPISVTRLEAYGKCPFRFFSEEILGLVEVDVEDLEEDRRERGRTVHRILERFYKEKTTPGFVGAATFQSEKARLAAIATQEMAIAAPPDPLMEWERDNWLTGGGGLLGNFLGREVEIARNQKEDGQPLLVEWRFDDLAVEDDHGNHMMVKGKVDRIDLLNRRYLCVLDYKTGLWSENLADMVKDGAHLQIPLYIEAARQKLDQGTVHGGGIYSLAETPANIPSRGHLILPDIGKAYNKRSKLTPEEFETMIKTAKQRALEHLGSIMTGRFPCSGHDEKVSGCKYCPFRWGCGRRTIEAGEEA